MTGSRRDAETQRAKLLDLAARLEKLPGANFAIECEIGRATGRLAHAFTASIEKALLLKPAGWYWRVGHGAQHAGWAHLNRVHSDHCEAEDEAHAIAATPALALCAAALRALACPRELKQAGYA